MISGAEAYATGFRLGVAPEPELTVDQWADAQRMLSPEETNEPGPWRTSRVPYLREILQRLSPSDPIEDLVVMKGAQIGASQAAICWLGFIMAHAPGPALYVLPTREQVQVTSRVRIDAMIASTPALQGRVARARSRDSRNTTFNKSFLGGNLMLRGANSAAAFRNVSARYLVLDDLDGYPGEVGNEGDPVTLARKRAATFPNRKILLQSTTGVRGLSRIEIEYNRGDQRRYFVPCRGCGRGDFLTWSGFRDFVGRRDGGHFRIEWHEGHPETAAAVCGACGHRNEDSDKGWMLEHGEWRPLKPEHTGSASYHLSALYSPPGWASWGDQAKEFERARNNPIELKAFVNTVLAESWEDRGSGAEPEDLLKPERLEIYPAEIPTGVGILVAAVDTQDDRLELVVKGYGAGEESWLIAFHQVAGDPAKDDVWQRLDGFLRRRFVHQSGRQLRIECVTVDSGGHHSEQVYRFAKMRRARNVFAVHGGRAQSEPIVGRPTRNNVYRALSFTLCTDTAKELIYARLAMGTAGAGYVHLPHWVDAEYIAQLTSERGVWKYVRGRGAVRIWEKRRGRERNEALDLEVYALAALRIMGEVVIGNLGLRAERFAAPLKPGAAAAPAVDAAAPAGATSAPAGQPDPVAARRLRKSGQIGWMSRLKR